MIKKIFNRIKNKELKSEFNRNMLTLMTGTTIAQAIPIAITPILTRLYTPEDFGVFAIFIAITSIFTVIVNGRYELAIMLPQKDEDAINIAALGLLISICFSLLFLALIIFFNTSITNFLGNKEISYWLYLMPFVIFISGAFNVLKYLNIRKKLYKEIAKTDINKSISISIIMTVYGFIKSGATGLILGRIISQIFGNLSLAKNIPQKYDIKKIKKFKIIKMAKKYKKFPKFSIWAGLANSSSRELVKIFISYIYSIKTLGFYFLPERVLGAPSVFISDSMGKIFFQQASNEKAKTGYAKKTFVNTLKKLSIISIVIFSILFFIIEDVFILVFGENWSVSGTYAKILIPLFCIRFVVSPLSLMSFIFNKNEIEMLWQFTLLAIYLLTASLAFYLKLSMENYLYIMVITVSLHYLILLKIISNYNK